MHLPKRSFHRWEVKVIHYFFWSRFVLAGSGISVPSVLRWYFKSVKRSCHPPLWWRAFSRLQNWRLMSKKQSIKISSPVVSRVSRVVHHSQHHRRRIGFFMCQEKFDPTACIFRIWWNSFKYSKLPVIPASWRETLSVQAIRKGWIKVQENHTRIQPATFLYKQEHTLKLLLFHTYLRCRNIFWETV